MLSKTDIEVEALRKIAAHWESPRSFRVPVYAWSPAKPFAHKLKRLKIDGATESLALAKVIALNGAKQDLYVAYYPAEKLESISRQVANYSWTPWHLKQETYFYLYEELEVEYIPF